MASDLRRAGARIPGATLVALVALGALCVRPAPSGAQDGAAAPAPDAPSSARPPAPASDTVSPSAGPPSPALHLGYAPGTDRRLSDWTALSAYYERLAAATDRVSLDTLGVTTRGRPLLMLVITSPENHARLDELREIQTTLADPRRIGDERELEELLQRGRAVVLQTHGIHSSEVGSTEAAPLVAHRLASSDDPEVRRILDQVVLLLVPSLNPDGTEWVADWYSRWVDTEYEAAPLPWLYHHYVGHDNNRDWYAFTQVETRAVVEGAHNAWRPHVVHDVHQMGRNGPRIFVPPYVEPWEPNVDPTITSSVNDLGTWVASRLVSDGKQGVVINSIYDAFTPARAYQHYHAGARILTETASARLATPDTLAPWQIRPRRGFVPGERRWNHPSPWAGGRWDMASIVDYMEDATMAMLNHVARNRREWLEGAYAVNRRAVEKWEEWPEAWVLPAGQEERPGLSHLLRILRTGDVEVFRTRAPLETPLGTAGPGSLVIPMRQPYAAFAQTLLEPQEYPELREYPGGPPIRPYDATAHTLPLLMGVEALPVEEVPPLRELVGEDPAPVATPEPRFLLPEALAGPDAPRIGLYKSWREPMEAGWTRWMLDRHDLPYDTLHDADVREGDLRDRYDVIVLQTQSPASIRNGWSERVMPPGWSGGLGVEGGRSLRDFVRSGGRLVAVESATDYVIGLLDLPVSNAVERLPADEFYVPGSIVRLLLEGTAPSARDAAGPDGRGRPSDRRAADGGADPPGADSRPAAPRARGGATAADPPAATADATATPPRPGAGPEGRSRSAGPTEVAAWFGDSSRAFAVGDPAVRIRARYGEIAPLLSGWMLGGRHLAGRAALVEAEVGRGSVILFGFQPNYRGQSVATWPLFFEALVPESTGGTAGGDP